MANRRELKRVERMNAADRPHEGRYANYLEVGYNAFEFLIDFGQRYSEEDRSQLHTCIVTSPAYAKSFLETLEKSVHHYEQSFGVIAQGDKDKCT